MAIDLKQITQEEIERILRKNLDLEGEVEIRRNDRISDLVGGNFQSTDLLEIMHELGIEGWKYSSGERLNVDGFDMLKYAVLGERITQDVCKLYNIECACAKGQEPVLTTDEVAKMITPGYLVRMAEYNAEHKPHSL